jgi:predicted NBD/HSP70 family sugar kinase
VGLPATPARDGALTAIRAIPTLQMVGRFLSYKRYAEGFQLTDSPGASQPGTPSLLRAINDRAALHLLLQHGPMSRAEIGALTGLSKPTASQLLMRLKDAGLVVLDGLREGQRGPSAELYAVNPTSAYVAGLDVTAERICAAVADVTGQIVAQHELPTPGRRGGDAVERTRSALLGALAQTDLQLSDLRQVVIGTPGAINPRTGRLEYAPELLRWHGPDLVDRLSEGLGAPVEVENDVNVVAVAEHDHGAAQDSSAFVLLWVSDGIGMAYVLDGRPHRGATGGSGEVGYMPVPGQPVFRDVSQANTGGYQCLAGGPALRHLLRDHGFAGKDPATALARAVATLDQPGERADRAAAVLAEFAGRLAVGLASVVAVLDPGLIVLAGDIPAGGGEPLRQRVEAELASISIGRPEVRLSSGEGNAVLLGALHLALSAARTAVFGRSVA